jgi:hypothetical protein
MRERERNPENGVWGQYPQNEDRMRQLLEALQCPLVPHFADEGEDSGIVGDSLIRSLKEQCICMVHAFRKMLRHFSRHVQSTQKRLFTVHNTTLYHRLKKTHM